MASDLTKWIKKNLVSRYLMTQCPEKRKCLEALEQILDDEATDQMRLEYQEHIDQCWGCYQDYKLEKAIRDLVKLKLERKTVPENLLNEIKSRISESK